MKIMTQWNSTIESAFKLQCKEHHKKNRKSIKFCLPRPSNQRILETQEGRAEDDGSKRIHFLLINQVLPKERSS